MRLLWTKRGLKRLQKRVIEILSVRHTLINIRTPKQL